MKLYVAAIALALGLSACSAAQDAAVNQAVTKAGSVATQAQAAISAVCTGVQSAESAVGVAGALPAVNNIEAYANSACSAGTATSAIVSAALNDPQGVQNTVNWVENLGTELKAAVPAAS